MTSDEYEHVRRAREGDREAYGRLVTAYQGMAFAVALNITGNYTDSEDVIQEAFLRAYQKLATLSDPTRFAPWLCQITRRAALQLLRKRRRVPVLAGEAELGERADADALTPAEVYARQELRGILWEEVAALPPRTREAILLYYMEGFSVKGAAAFLGISEDAVKMRLHFGREKLREGLLPRIEADLRQHRPSEKTRARILAALPPAGSPALLWQAARWTCRAASAKAGAAVGGVAVALLVALFAFTRGLVPSLPPSPSAPASPAPVQEEDATQQAAPATAPAAEAPEAAATAVHAIEGRVVEHLTGAPVAGVAVRVSRGDARVADLLSDEAGNFSVPDLADGDYAVGLACEGSPAPVAEGYDFTGMQGRRLVRLHGGDVRGVTFALMPGTYIAGRVVDEADAPVPGAKLHLDGYEGQSFSLDAEAGASGEFRFAGLTPSRYYALSCSAEGATPVCYRGVEAEVGRPLGDFVVRLVRDGGTVRGQVVNREGQPVEGVCLVLTPVMGGVTDFRRAQTGPDGCYEVAGVSPGTTMVVVETDWKLKRNVDVQAGAATEGVDFTVDTEVYPGRLTGRIRDERGNPITEGNVSADSDGYFSVEPLSMGMVDEEGRFTLANLPLKAEVKIRYRGNSGPFRDTSVAKVRVPASDLDVVVVDEEPGEPERITVRGRVVDAAGGQPIASFRIGYARGPMQWVCDPQGRFEFGDVPLVDELSVVVDADGYARRTEPVKVRRGALEADVELRLNGGVTVQGRVVDPEGRPVPGARVRLNGWFAETGHSYTLSDASGNFALNHLSPSEKYWPQVSHPNYAPFEGKTFWPVKVQGILTLPLSRGGAITGRVFDESGRPLGGVPVLVGQRDWGVRGMPRTDAQGSYSADRLAPGDYQLTALTGSTPERQVTVEEGKTTRADFGAAAGSAIVGTVTVDGAPLSPARVIACDRPNVLGQGAVSVSTEVDEAGRFRLEGLPPGPIYLLAVAQRDFVACERVEVPEQDEIQHDLQVRTGAVRGTVRTTDGSPLAERPPVYVTHNSETGPLADAPIVAFGEVGPDGSFEIARLAPGTYFAWSGTRYHKPGEPATIEVRPGELVDGVVVLVEPRQEPPKDD